MDTCVGEMQIKTHASKWLRGDIGEHCQEIMINRLLRKILLSSAFARYKTSSNHELSLIILLSPF